MAVVHYFLQDEGKKELYMYMIEDLKQDQVKFKDVIRTFPESGRFHFRFRIAIPDDRGNATATWMDYIDPERQVPLFKGNIITKVLQLPPFSNSRLIRHSSKTYKVGLSELYKPPVQAKPAKQRPSVKETVQRAPSPRPPEPQPATAPEQPVSKTEQEPTAPAQSSDLLWSPFKAAPATQSFFPPDNADPTNGKTEEELRAEKKKQVKQAIDDKVDDYKRRMAEEEQIKFERMRSRDELGEVMDRWETRNMVKNNIRALLSTVHTVLWPGANWQPLTMSQLLAPAGVKRGYLAAMLKFHPDKHNNDPPNVKYTCERVFSALNEAWKVFQSEAQSV